MSYPVHKFYDSTRKTNSIMCIELKLKKNDSIFLTYYIYYRIVCWDKKTNQTVLCPELSWLPGDRRSVNTDRFIH
jgi:hypothetical protein